MGSDEVTACASRFHKLVQCRSKLRIKAGQDDDPWHVTSPAADDGMTPLGSDTIADAARIPRAGIRSMLFGPIIILREIRLLLFPEEYHAEQAGEVFCTSIVQNTRSRCTSKAWLGRGESFFIARHARTPH